MCIFIVKFNQTYVAVVVFDNLSDISDPLEIVLFLLNFVAIYY